MSFQSARRPSPALIVAIIALVAALTGSAIALPGTNSVKSNDIATDSVKSKHVKNDKLTGADIDEASLGAVPSAQNAATTSVVKTAQGKITNGQTATLLQHGPLTVTVECDDANANTDLDAVAYIASSAENTVFTSYRDGSNVLGAGTAKADRELTSPTWADSTGTYATGYDGGEPFSATAASGAGIMGDVALAAEKSSNTCWYWMDATILG